MNEAHLYEFVTKLTDWNLVFAKQNANRPAKPYATIAHRPLASAQFSENFEPDADGFRTVRGNRLWAISLDFYGKNALAEAEMVVTKLGVESYAGLAANFLFGVGTVAPIRDLTALLNESTQYEERAQVEFNLRWISLFTEEVMGIEEVEIITENATVILVP